MPTLSQCAAGIRCTSTTGAEGLDNSTHFCFDCRGKIHSALFCGKVLEEYTNESRKLDVDKLSPEGRDSFHKSSHNCLYICHTCINRHELLESTTSIGDKDNNEDDDGDNGDDNNHHATKKRKGLDVIEIDGDVFPSDVVVVDHDGRGGMELSQLSGNSSSPARIDTATAASARTGNIFRPPKKSKSNNGSKKKKRPPISDSNLEKQVNQVRDISGGGNIVDSSLRNIVDSSLSLTTNDNEDDDNEEVNEGTKYITLPINCGKNSPWWVGFELFNPVKHPTLYKAHVMCKECSTFKNNPDAGIIKIGISQSTSNLRSHKKHHHPAEYETITKGLSKTTMKSNGGLINPTSIMNMPGFTVKVKTKDAKLLFRTAATTLAIEEGVPFRLFSQDSFRRLFIPLNAESNKIVNLSRNDVRDSVVEMGEFAVEATKREIRNHQISWTTDHWTGVNKLTYTTVTAHWIDKTTWKLHSACLDFKPFEGSTTGERIYEDIVAVLQKYQGEAEEDVIVFDTIGITDTTGNMGKLGKYLRDNGKEHGYCTDHNLHLVAKLAFDREIVFVCVIFFHPLL
jgi:hypothetical protein